MGDDHAVLLQRDGRSVLRLERLLDHPRERVWRALTEREQLEMWHPTPFLLEQTPGGTVTFPPSAGAPDMGSGRVLECEEPSLLVHTWGEDELRWTLEQRAEGCLLTLEHSFEDRFKAARDGAGWHVCLVALAAVVDGREAPDRGSAASLPSGWSELNADYQRRFGIAPDQATQVPPM
jgi:uncharacterized protein YndB with AHSA1/START domain